MNITQRISIAWRIIRQCPGSLMAHANREHFDCAIDAAIAKD